MTDVIDTVQDRGETPQRPLLFVETVRFSDDTTLNFDDDEIVVFVGPNNAGKSAALREIQEFVSTHIPQNVVKHVTFRKSGNGSTLLKYLEDNAQKIGTSADLQYAGIGYSIHHRHVHMFDDITNLQPIAGFFCTRLPTETRITSSNPAKSIALFHEAPSHPIHLLLMDDRLANRISSLFKLAFGEDLIVFRGGGGKFPLYVGRKPSLQAGEDALSRTYIDRLIRDAVPLEKQGDGIRSFVSVLLYVLAAENHTIQFLDEPEAFLHPPQARLIGEFIARERRGASQLFIATHSPDILEGIVAGARDNVRIIRIQRDGNINRVKELSRTKTSAIANDTFARYSGVLSGIFYRHVIICESDADCLFYSSLLRSKSVSKDRNPDVLFVHASGKHRMAQLAETLRSLDVPVSVIADLDILSELSAFKEVVEKLSGSWPDMIGHWSAIKTAVEERRPPFNAEQIVRLIKNEIDDVSGIGEFPKDRERKIKAIFKVISAWDELKHVGRSFLRGASAVQQFDKLDEKCAAIGLWFVPVGELEGFCRTVPGHGPAFVGKILEEMNLDNDHRLQEAREFVSKIWMRVRRDEEDEKIMHPGAGNVGNAQ